VLGSSDDQLLNRSMSLTKLCDLQANRRSPARNTFAFLFNFCLIVGINLTTDAGDILRGGMVTGAVPSAPARAPAAGNMQPASANRNDSLARTTQALQAVQAMQAAARDLAKKGPANLGLDPNHPGIQLPNIPNGLAAGGLQVAPGVPANLAHPAASDNPALWTGATLPAQSATNGQTNVTITQTAQQALLNWQTFNVGKETTVSFNQSAGGTTASQWIAFNTISDPSGVPSQILGSIDALGQVYLINQNGIIFGGASQVNLHALVASSLPLNANLVERGLLNNPDDQFLFSSLAIPILPNGGTMPAFNPPPPPATPGGRIGDVTVQAGAVLSSPTTPDHVGGRIALIGPNVTNDGTISTPDGQTILAAGQQVGFTAHATSDPSLRGLDVFVGAIDPISGTATNGGLIESPRADVTMVGKNLNQLGFIDSSTSVALNGRIDLQADYNTVVSLVVGVPHFNPSISGTVTLGQGSVTQILPEVSSSETVVGTQLALSSQVNLRGEAIHLADDALLVAPGANVAMGAGTWIPYSAGYSFTYSEGQIYLDLGALIDVSGSRDVIASVTDNIISAQLLGPELANFPLQRNGPLRGQTIQVDIRQHGPWDPTLNNGEGGYSWIGTPLADVSGYVNLIQHTAGQLTIGGGTVSLTAGESVVMQRGSKIDVSGGWIDYQGGVVQTTQVIADGRIYDISQASPDRIYDGIYSGFQEVHPKWGIVETMGNPLGNNSHFEPSYAQGGNGGTISITAPGVALDGSFLGTTTLGPRLQSFAPAPGTLSLVFANQQPISPLFQQLSPTPPDVTFDAPSTLAPADVFGLDPYGKPLTLRDDRRNDVILSPDLVNEDGFGNLTVNNGDGDISVPASASLTTLPGGSITLQGANIDVEGQVSSPGGSLTFAAYDFSPYELAILKITPEAQTPPADANRGGFTLGRAASLNVAGLIIDDRLTTMTPDTVPPVTTGGSVTINSYNTTLKSGSGIDVSGGVEVTASAKANFGAGGNIVITAGQDPNVPSIIGGHLLLGATLRGYAGSQQGGSLSILAPLIQIGGEPAQTDTLALQPAFFDGGGFSGFTITGLGAAATEAGQYIPGVAITPGTVIAPIVQSWLFTPDDGPVSLTPTVVPEALRAPIALILSAPGVRDTFNGNLISRGDMVVGSKSFLSAGANSSVSLSGDTVAVLGSITAPGGNITINGATNSALLFTDQSIALPTVDLAPGSVLSVAGTTLLTPNPLGYRSGSVLPGGSISVSGNIVAQAGALLDVSGTSGILDLAPGYSNIAPSNTPGSSPVVATVVQSDAGSINLNGGQELFVDSTLLGTGGGSSAVGGNLTISSGRFYPQGTATPPTPLDVTMMITQAGPTIPTSFQPAGSTAIGRPVFDSEGGIVDGLGHFAASSLDNHSFDSVTVKGTVDFSDPVTLTANRQLIIGTSGVIYANATTNLDAPYVALGTSFQPPVSPLTPVPPFTVAGEAFYFSPTTGTGVLNVTGGFIDIGNLSLQNIGTADFIAASGDIRGDGTLDVAGTISMTAGQIYPPTAVTFTVSAFNYVFDGITYLGSINVHASGNRPLPLSAGGELNLYAAMIDQDGVLRAPLGRLNLGDGILALPAVDPISNQPFAATQQLAIGPNSVSSASAVEPATGQAVPIPFGTNPHGTSWIDPAGIDITTGGVPGKVINIASVNVDDQTNSSIDLRGGGDLLTYRFIPGVGGTTDILGSSSSFAVMPGYQFDYVPFDPLYSNAALSVGDRIYLNAGGGLAAGSYTLLPARYALLPGALLITPKDGTPSAGASQPDGSSIVSGYRFNDLGGFQPTQPLNSLFEIAPPTVVQARAIYQTFSANSFLLEGAQSHDLPVPRLPIDSGELIFAAASKMNLNGKVVSQAPGGGLGGLVDISSPSDILISPTGDELGILRLDPQELSTFGADSLLVGGFRQSNSDGSFITVTTGNVVVDNYGSPLTGPDLILVANNSVIVNPRSVIEQDGMLTAPAETLLLGTEDVAGSGDGALLRVTSDPAAQIMRSGVSSSTVPNLVIAENVQLSGQSVILDSSSAMRVEPSAMLSGNSVALNSGQISLVLSNPGVLNSSSGLVLYSSVLRNIEASAQSLSLLSYSSFDIYGIGEVGALGSDGQPALASLSLHAAEIRGFNNLGGTVFFRARDIALDNSANAAPAGSTSSPIGTLTFTGDTIAIGANQLMVDQFANLTLAALGGVLLQDTGGLTTQGNLSIIAPVITGAGGASQNISATGDLTISLPAARAITSISGELGASLTLTGANVTAGGTLRLPSGVATLHATTGNVLVGGAIDVSGTAQSFFDVTKYSNGGEVSLSSDLGYVLLPPGSVIDVAAQPGGGNAGSLSISAPTRFFEPGGTLLGQAGENGLAGSFSLDTGVLGTVAPLDRFLDAGSFSLARTIRVRSGDVLLDGQTYVHSLNLSADGGSITVTGTVDASGVEGGNIDLEAFGDLVLSPGSVLTVAAQQIDAAGKAGAIALETTHGTVRLTANSTIDLSVANGVGGTLHLRAPQSSDATDLAIDPIAGSIRNAASIIAEGFFVQDAATPGAATIDNFEPAALANATAFEANAAVIRARLLADNPGLESVLHIRPGEEIDNSQGDLVLNSDWDLSTWRFGTIKPVVDNDGNFLYDYFGNQIFAGVESGILTLRASGSITLNGSLADGFGDSGGDIPFDDSGNFAPWKETLLPRFADGTTQESWSFRITTGADFSAADFRRLQPLSSLGAAGSLLIGVNGGTNIVDDPGSTSSDSALEGHYQVIRTGTGDIEVSVGQDVQLLNQFATIYTAGGQVGDPTLGGTFDTPRLFSDPDGFFLVYPAQYSSGGGNVTIVAQNDILHLTQDIDGNLIPDSERELPMSWLDRRGYVDPTTGEFGLGLFGDVTSTSWWVDFSNFFEGIGALGGGNVTVKAGRDISNVDAVVPTNARAPKGLPDASNLVELGGGNLIVQSGRDIDGGVYYVERGSGTLSAGNAIHTNSTRSPSLTIIANEDPFPSETWLPTTFFLGKGAFTIQATGDVLLGPVVNPFLLTPGLQNTYWYKTYFSTYAATSGVEVSSLNGSVTLRNTVTLPTTDFGGTTPVLLAWLQNELVRTDFGDTAAFYQPWLSSAETDASPFFTATDLLPPNLRVAAFAGDINLNLKASLYPASTGTLDLVASDAINGLQINGETTINDIVTNAWAASTINLSDADPNSIPGVTSPFAYQAVVGTNTALASVTQTGFLTFFDQHFNESGSTEGTFGVLQTKQALHAPGLLHLNDDDPVHVYAATGDISGLTLFSAKTARIVAGADLTDAAFYIQNNKSSDVTVVAAGRDMILYDANSSLRSAATAAGNALDFGELPLAGDVQISGPGTLEVLAGRDLDLGIGNNNPDGTALGITSIGNGRNPSLPFTGAAVVAGAGIGAASGLSDSQLDFSSFIAQFLNPDSAPIQAARYLPETGVLLAMATSSDADIWTAFNQLPPEERDRIVLNVFYLVLRDAGRDHNDPASSGFNNFDSADAAIAALFPSDEWMGDMSLTSREIKTQNGGDISLFTPGGALTVGFEVGENQAVDQGILTEHGGNISIFAKDDVSLGTSRIFTLRGGNEIIYSADGDIAAGAASKTVLAAPPTRILIDPQSADVQTDLAGLATGGGIGVLESVTGVPPGDVDLIAPTGTVDAGDAGIRVSGNLNISAVLVLNANNIQVGGTSVGTPIVVAPNIANLTAASNTVGATSSAANEATQRARSQTEEEVASIVTVEVLGYGGGEGDENQDDQERRRKKS
jgi:filamentous hemagglutinin